MALEIVNLLQDLREYVRVSRRRKALREADAGIDYGDEQYQDVVRRVVSRIHPRRMRLRVTDIIQETATTKTLRLERIDAPLPPFRAGQYVNVFVDVDGILTSRPYSIASAPPLSSPPVGETEGGEALELTVRDKPGGFVAPYLLNEVQVGDELETTGPEGSFYYEPLIDGDELVFLAGGSGITPFMSIIRDVLQRELPLKMHLLYGSRTPDDVIYGAELAELAAAHASTGSRRGPTLDYALVISEPPPGYEGLTGLLDAKLIAGQVGDPSAGLKQTPALRMQRGARDPEPNERARRALTGKTFFICGPGVMHDFCLAALAELGVPAHRIRRELYGPPDDVTKEPGWPEGLAADTIFEVEVVGTLPLSRPLGAIREGRTVRAPAGEPLINTLERYNIAVPAICRTGACSACRTRLLSGRVFMPAHTGLRESDREHGYIHACVAYPLEDLRIQI
jgi:ferredoxin-NADP reductase